MFCHLSMQSQHPASCFKSTRSKESFIKCESKSIYFRGLYIKGTFLQESLLFSMVGSIHTHTGCRFCYVEWKAFSAATSSLSTKIMESGDD
jgi:hypothetical protein